MKNVQQLLLLIGVSSSTMRMKLKINYPALQCLNNKFVVREKKGKSREEKGGNGKVLLLNISNYGRITREKENGSIIFFLLTLDPNS